MSKHINIVLSRPPGPDSDFIECEDDSGCGVGGGEWIRRADGYWALRITEKDLVEDLVEVQR